MDEDSDEIDIESIESKYFITAEIACLNVS